jgi:hypothetical protein
MTVSKDFRHRASPHACMLSLVDGTLAIRSFCIDSLDSVKKQRNTSSHFILYWWMTVSKDSRHRASPHACMRSLVDRTLTVRSFSIDSLDQVKNVRNSNEQSKLNHPLQPEHELFSIFVFGIQYMYHFITFVSSRMCHGIAIRCGPGIDITTSFAPRVVFIARHDMQPGVGHIFISASASRYSPSDSTFPPRLSAVWPNL